MIPFDGLAARGIPLIATGSLLLFSACTTVPDEGTVAALEESLEPPCEEIEIAGGLTTNVPPLKVVPYPSPNFSERTLPIDTILLHYTATDTAERALRHLANPRAKLRVSAHYVVAADGTIYRMVDESKRAWHAGNSFWRGVTDLNSASIGIEIVNAGVDGKGARPPYPDAQVASVIALCKDIQTRHTIKWVLGHSDVAPERKQDPGEHFPWKRLAAEGIGLWTDGFARPTGDAKTMLSGIGYDTTNLPKTLTAFYRHFYPEVMTTGGTNTLGRIAAVAELCPRRL